MRSAECVPRLTAEVEVGRLDLYTVGKQRGQLLGVQLAKSDEVVQVFKTVYVDEGKARAEFFRCEAVEDLDKLQLIEKVVFEPEDDLVVRCVPDYSIIALREAAKRVVVCCPTYAGDELRTSSRELFGELVRYWAVVKDIDPGQELSWKFGLAQSS